AIRPRERPWSQFDICDSQYCQAYYGAQTETPSTTNALKETEGLVALYQGEPILALYSSSHGGYGESYSFAFSDPKTNKFPATPLPYLQGGPDIPEVVKSFGDLRKEKAAESFWKNASVKSFDVLSPHYRWAKNWTRQELEATLQHTLPEVSQNTTTAPFVTPAFKPGTRLGTLKNIEVTERGVSGKAMAIEIETTQGRWLLKKEFVIRKVFKSQGKMLPSANIVFNFQPSGSDKLAHIHVNGGGFGHGVGMSQLGASMMDKQGAHFPDILQHYYKGIAIGTLPLQVGAGHYLQPVKTSFYSKTGEGVLWVESPTPVHSVTVELNGHLKTLAVGGDGKGTDEKVPGIPDSPDLSLGTEPPPVPSSLVQGKTSPLYKKSFSVKSLLKANRENTLVLYPDMKQPSKILKAWIEVIPAR
ncbi:MAG: SpoIID/LytB domain-containing protein, partial [Cyanobacteria bacterium]|nr:SpoIID/LytB domain-containing protein [Cyanobacteriota bacterium]